MSAHVQVRNPFRGLQPFRETDATLFFGRDEQIGEALERLLQRRLLMVVGVSGCGKSSLVSAGIIPALQLGLAGNAEQRWRIATMRPGDGPVEELTRCLGIAVGSISERTYGLAEVVETLLPKGENLLLVVDQFEEIFPFHDKSRSTTSGEADLFVSWLLRASQEPDGRIFVLLSMRSDYLGECAKFHGLPEALNDSQYLVPRMTRRQLMEAIESPLESVDVEVHPTVVQDLLNQCDEEPDNLPLLQHLLSLTFEKWKANGEQGPITAELVKSLGGLKDALDHDAEKVYGQLNADGQRMAELIFRRITEGREIGNPIRRPQRLNDLAGLAAVAPGIVRGTVQSFVSRGLLTVRDTEDGERLDLPHECLSGKWLRLKAWIQLESEEAKKLRFLLDAVGKTHLTGEKLSEADAWLRDGHLNSTWCLRYVSLDQQAAIVSWVHESSNRAEAAAKAEKSSKTTRVVALLSLLVALVFIAIAFGALRLSKSADTARKAAQQAREKEELERKRAEDSFEMIQRSLLIRQAALAGDEKALKDLLSPLSQNTAVEFSAVAKDLQYKNPNGEEIYQFSLFPEAATLPEGENAIAFVTYLADHPTFKNTLMITGPNRQFRASYDGWGCLEQIVALIEYKNPAKQPSVAEFDMCKKLGWE
jgi:hypothetical protein